MRDHSALIGTIIHEAEATVAARDHILYALALGYGSDPVAADHLAHVYEENLVTLPGMAMIIAYPGFWMRDPRYGFNWQQVLHAEEAIEIHTALPVAGRVHGRTVIEDVVDRGEGKGCFVYLRKELRDAGGTLLASVVSNTLARADGGFGGGGTPRPPMPAPPARVPDTVVDLSTLPQAALLYRLSGDMNPLHADPVIARAAGFERPILHGRCTLSMAIRALIDGCCERDATRLRSVAVRFTAPVLPGETLRTELWQNGAEIGFRTSVVEREIVVLNNGIARIVI
ncbi:MAG: MaoC family dehydratase N-terminal domain-containing protein [Gammaproteobacteria bacterium]|nr:MaoC family dehydratase N-terminal domain-containing protein [Gammaproteobacteria bacterium]